MLTTSIALCTYNGEEFLPEQLGSIADQTQLPDELVIVDDGSTDESLKIAHTFAGSSAFPVRVLSNETNRGSTKNFERAIKECTGEVIFLCDQDDIWLPDKLAKMTARFTADPDLALLFSDAEIVAADLTPLGFSLWDKVFRKSVREEFSAGREFEVLLWQNRVTGAATAFRSRFRERLLPIPEVNGMIHDGWIAIALAASATVDFIDEKLILYRQHGGQQLGLGCEVPETRAARFARDLKLNEAELERIRGFHSVLRENPNFAGRDRAIIDEYIARREELAEHYAVRAEMPASVTDRVRAVVGEMNTGRYSRYSRKYLSPLKDLFLR
jgi:glycosyltransferase involved in cell wall biosynthesis